MLRSLWRPTVCSLALLLAIPGCGTNSQWTLTFENQNSIACSVFITLGADQANSSTVSVADVAKGKPITLIAGGRDTVVQTVKVVRGDDEQNLTPKAALAVGKKVAIVVRDDGKMEAAITD